MSDEPVTIIDREVLRVLSVDTRMDILKMLSEGARTPSFIGKKLNKSDATIIEHLDKMAKAGLVSRTVSPGKKWIFYGLTERGSGIVSSKSRRLVIILATSFITLLGGAASLSMYAYKSNALTNFAARDTAQATSETLKAVGSYVPAIAIDPLVSVSAVLIAASIASFGLYFYKRSRMGVAE
jgi:DNA-binding transcriptional ArsR family regulator